MRLNDVFDEIVCINRDSRTDRWADCERVFAAHEITVTRISAFEGSAFNLQEFLTPTFLRDPTIVGVFGCNMSHLFAVKYAQQKGLRNILILEDDVEFRDDLAGQLTLVARELPADWDMLYFSGNHRAPPVRVSPHIFRLVNSVATHAYAVNAKAYVPVLNALCRFVNAPDTNYVPIQPHIKAYLAYPHLAWQRPGYSDLMNQFCDNTFLKDM